MSENDEVKAKSAAIVFGGHSPIGLSCARSLAQTHQVFLITRRIDKQLIDEIGDNSAIIPIEADIANQDAANSVIQKIYRKGFEPTALAFLQRYRPTGEPSFEEHARVELWSIAEILDEVARCKDPETAVNVILSSSPAAHKVVNDQDLAYHVIKAGQEALVRFYGVKMYSQRICVNAVRIGSLVIKARAQEYWDSIPHVVTGLMRLSPSGRVLTSQEVGARLAGLLHPGVNGLTGQVVTVDDGYSLLDGAQITRSALDFGAQ